MRRAMVARVRTLAWVSCLLLLGCGGIADQSVAAPDAPLHADAGSGLRMPTPEICNNGNGAIDEGCPCGGGQTQACWPGALKDRHRGSCKDGVQACVGSGEFHSWGTCV